MSFLKPEFINSSPAGSGGLGEDWESGLGEYYNTTYGTRYPWGLNCSGNTAGLTVQDRSMSRMASAEWGRTISTFNKTSNYYSATFNFSQNSFHDFIFYVYPSYEQYTYMRDNGSVSYEGFINGFIDNGSGNTYYDYFGFTADYTNMAYKWMRHKDNVSGFAWADGLKSEEIMENLVDSPTQNRNDPVFNPYIDVWYVATKRRWGFLFHKSASSLYVGRYYQCVYIQDVDVEGTHNFSVTLYALDNFKYRINYSNSINSRTISLNNDVCSRSVSVQDGFFQTNRDKIGFGISHSIDTSWGTNRHSPEFFIPYDNITTNVYRRNNDVHLATDTAGNIYSVANYIFSDRMNALGYYIDYNGVLRAPVSFTQLHDDTVYFGTAPNAIGSYGRNWGYRYGG